MSNGKGFGSNPDFEKIKPKTFNKWQKKAIHGDRDAQIKVTNYYRNMWNKGSYLPDSTFIHERDYEPMDCCLCGEHMPSIHDTHNPYPFTKRCTAKEALDNNLPHRCCNSCNAIVTAKRREEWIAKGEILPDEKGAIYIFDWMNNIVTEDLAEHTKFIIPFMDKKKKKKKKEEV